MLNAISQEAILTKEYLPPFLSGRALLELSCLLKNRAAKERFQSEGAKLFSELGRANVEYWTEGNIELIDTFGNLTEKDIQVRQISNLEKYKLSDVPSVPIGKDVFYS
jgi:hypothetical protein